jgi:hypothetical protein
MAVGQLNRSCGVWLGAAKPHHEVAQSERGRHGTEFRDVGRARAIFGRAPRRPACADSDRSSRSLRDPFTALGRLG